MRYHRESYIIMIYSIEAFSKSTLTNDLHDEFMHECVKIISGIESSENVKFTTMKTEFLEAFSEEEKWFIRSKVDPSLGKLHQLSQERAHAYSGMKQAIKSVKMAKLNGYERTEVLLKHFNTYQKNLKTSVEGLTAIIRNLLNDLSQEEEQQVLTETGTMVYYNRLMTLNEEVENQKMLCRDYDSQTVTAALKKARSTMDHVYDEAVKIMEGCANMLGGSYEKAIALWNASIRKFKETVKLRLAIREAAKKKEEANKQPTDVAPETNQPNGQTGGNSSDNQPNVPQPEEKPSTGTEGKLPQPGAKPDQPNADGNQSSEQGDKQPETTNPEGEGTGGLVTEARPEAASV